MKTRHILTALLGTCLMIASLSSFADEVIFSLTPQGKATVKTTATSKTTEDSGTVYLGSLDWGYFIRTATQLNIDSNHMVEEITVYAGSVMMSGMLTESHQLQLIGQLTMQGVSNGYNFGQLGQVSSTNYTNNPDYRGATYSWGSGNDSNTIIVTY